MRESVKVNRVITRNALINQAFKILSKTNT
jgi:hypothetical protein